MNKSDLDPWQVVLGHLLEIDSHRIPGVIEKTGMTVDWSLTDQQNYSNKYRIAAYRPRINSAYSALPEQDKLRVIFLVVSELGPSDELNSNLNKIGWKIEDNRLTTTSSDVKELFFPKDTQHDAYIEIRNIFKRTKSAISVVDPYLDSSIFVLLGNTLSSSLRIRLLTYKVPNDFSQEMTKFFKQYPNFTIEARKSKEFHDRFIIIDSDECWHIGCSIKDAGDKAFMLSKIEDPENIKALISQVKNSWSIAEKIA